MVLAIGTCDNDNTFLVWKHGEKYNTSLLTTMRKLLAIAAWNMIGNGLFSSLMKITTHLMNQLRRRETYCICFSWKDFPRWMNWTMDPIESNLLGILITDWLTDTTRYVYFVILAFVTIWYWQSEINQNTALNSVQLW